MGSIFDFLVTHLLIIKLQLVLAGLRGRDRVLYAPVFTYSSIGMRRWRWRSVDRDKVHDQREVMVTVEDRVVIGVGG